MPDKTEPVVQLQSGGYQAKIDKPPRKPPTGGSNVQLPRRKEGANEG